LTCHNPTRPSQLRVARHTDATIGLTVVSFWTA
jgi:hypothetical protein